MANDSKKRCNVHSEKKFVLGLVMKTFGGKTYSKKEIDDMIKEADTDSDGKVSYAGTS